MTARPPDTERYRYRAGPTVPFVSFAALLIGVLGLGLRWSFIPVLVFLAAYYALWPRLMRRVLDRFERDALALFTRGRFEELLRHARRHLLLHLSGPAAAPAGWEGLALAQLGRHAEALPLLEQGRRGAPPSRLVGLAAARAKALLIVGRFEEAEEAAETLLAGGTRLAETQLVLARARLGRGFADDRVEAALAGAEQLNPDADVRLAIALSRVEAALLAGRRPPELPAGADSRQGWVRGWIHLVRGRLRERRDDAAAALDSYRHAGREAPGTFVATLAQERIAQLGGGPTGAPAATTPRDPFVEGKRKRRQRG